MAETDADTGSREECAYALGRAVEPVGQDFADPIGWLLVNRCTLELLIRLGKGCRTGLRRIAEVPDDTAGDNRGQIHLVGQTMAVLFIGQKIGGERQATPR